MSDRPACSVCVANFNGDAVLRDCLRSILDQDSDFEVEIIVHDDASTDNSARIVREEFPSVRLIESPENLGFCIANNRMVAAAKGEYVLLLNNDACLLPDALDTLYRASRDSAPCIFGLPQYDAHSGDLLDRGSLLDPFFNPVPNRKPSRQQVAMVMGACLWMPRALWNELGGFPEWFGSIGEDLYLCCVARLTGTDVRVLPNSGYRHHVGQSFGGGKLKAGRMDTTIQRRTLSERNKTFVMVIVVPQPWLALLLPLHLLLLAIEALVLTVMMRRLDLATRVYAAVPGSLWAQRRQLLERRRYWQARRQRRMLGQFTFLPYKLRMLLQYGLPRVNH